MGGMYWVSGNEGRFGEITCSQKSEGPPREIYRSAGKVRLASPLTRTVYRVKSIAIPAGLKKFVHTSIFHFVIVKVVSKLCDKDFADLTDNKYC